MKHIVLIVLVINRTRFSERTLEENWVTSILMNESLMEDLVLSGLALDTRNQFPVAAMKTNGYPGEALYSEDLVYSRITAEKLRSLGTCTAGQILKLDVSLDP